MKVLIIIVLVILLSLAWAGYTFYTQVQVSRALMKEAKAYDLTSGDYRVSLLVLGDSTGVGVGASRPEDTVAGRLAHSLGATSVENYAVSGAVVADLPAQVAAAKQKTYTAILLQIGGNDIIRFHNAERVGRELEQILKTLPAAEKIILMSAGDVSSAHLFPFFVRPFHTALNQKYHRVFERIATAFGAQYVNLYTLPAKDPFVLEPKKYFSLDGLHPSSEGYRVWFERLELGS